jgi:redox-sensing transcriptional repressor
MELERARVETISSAEMERQTGINAAQFRKDLSYFGEFGKPGVGYTVVDLQDRITRILKIDRRQPVILVGAVNLGSALVGYPGFQEKQMELVAVFDNSAAKVGTVIHNLTIQDFRNVKELNQQLQARIAILAVPASGVQRVADDLVQSGIKAILNFAPATLKVSEDIVVRNVSFMQELAVLSYHTSSRLLVADSMSPTAHKL